MLSPKVKRQVLQIIPFALIWILFALIYLFIEKGILGNFQYYPSTGNPYNFKDNLVITLISATIFGILVGTFETLYLGKIFSKTTLTKKILYKTSIYSLITFLFLFINTIITNSLELNTNISDPKVWDNALIFLRSFAFWSIELYIATIMLVSLFYTEVSNNLGQKVLINFFTGKYHSPVEEERIFMFLDMKSSTTIAEKIGHFRYFQMLKEYYSDLSEAIVQYDGEIYQYVGDEIVVTWNLERGLRKNNCIKCFFEMEKSLKSKSQKYNAKFDIHPTFKAGMHYGKVTTGEIGTIKKDITFSGDVLNTAARIQGLCNTYDVNLIVSNQLLDLLTLEPPFRFKSLGEVTLRGKDQSVSIFNILEE